LFPCQETNDDVFQHLQQYTEVTMSVLERMTIKKKRHEKVETDIDRLEMRVTVHLRIRTHSDMSPAAFA